MGDQKGLASVLLAGDDTPQPVSEVEMPKGGTNRKEAFYFPAHLTVSSAS